jgi:hypothetical protein
MNFTFDIYSIRTVPSDYSWDQGVPLQAGGFDSFVTDLSACVRPSSNSSGTEYVGYAPFVSVSLSSAPGTTSKSLLILKRVADFGDYYNSDSNVVAVPSVSSELFNHVYVMPGLYNISVTRTEYIEAAADQFNAYGDCLQRHCIDWSWKTLANCTDDFAVTWSSTLSGNAYEKKWKFEPCEEDWATNNGLFVESSNQKQKSPLSWQWYNYKCSSPGNPDNTAVTWLSAGFQQPGQLTWTQAAGPCIELTQQSQVNWRWEKITASGRQFTSLITWDETKSSESGNATWDFVAQNCTGSVTTTISSSVQTITKQAYIRVLEIPPTAYLRAIQSEDRESPLTVRLSPRDTLCGSFPIERIVWDLGDGSPLLTQRRWSNTLDQPFVYAGLQYQTSSEVSPLDQDYQDPRNYDVIHTYIRTGASDFCFYPSITAFASSTNSSDCAAAMVGPIKLASSSGSSFKLLHNELTDHGKVIVGQVDNNIAVWTSNSQS